jgi:hypothetical protein
MFHEAIGGRSLSPSHTNRPLCFSRGEKNAKVVEVSSKSVQRERFPPMGALPIWKQDSRPYTASRSGENACGAGGAPTRIPLRGSGSKFSPGRWPILNGAAATSSGSCSAAPLVAISPYTSAPYSEGCSRSGPICWQPGRSSGRKKCSRAQHPNQSRQQRGLRRVPASQLNKNR